MDDPHPASYERLGRSEIAMTTERADLFERRDLVRRDLEELSAQEDDGEVTAATADRLRKAYQAELDSLDTAIKGLPDREPETQPARQAATPRDEDANLPHRSPRRVLVGSLIIVAVLSAVIFFAARDSSPRDAAPAAGAPGELSIDPASVSNEQLEAVVAANPEIIGMRMALADRYFDAQNYGAALDHYLYIADNATAVTDESRALARIGWMAHVTGLPQEAEDYVRASLQLDPTNAEGVMYLGFVTLYGLGDAEAAIPQLEAALELANLSPNVVSQIEAALDEARRASTP